MALESATFRWFTVRMMAVHDFSLDFEATRASHDVAASEKQRSHPRK